VSSVRRKDRLEKIPEFRGTFASVALEARLLGLGYQVCSIVLCATISYCRIVYRDPIIFYKLFIDKICIML